MTNKSSPRKPTKRLPKKAMAATKGGAMITTTMKAAADSQSGLICNLKA